jgi:hypothetical protein
VDVRAWQFGPGGVCLNLLARFLEYDIARNPALTLRVARLATPSPGSGAINQATLVLETDVVPPTDELFATGFEEPSAPLVRCQRPPLDLTPNGAMESNLSPLTLIQASTTPMTWKVRSLFDQADFGPFVFGGNFDATYVGRFGGRSRMNLGFWNAASGTLTFSTGAGPRTLGLAGDWANTTHTPIPGDYDGDGITDLGMVVESATGALSARIRFSSTDSTEEFAVDPRGSAAGQFSSGVIFYGPGQDTDGDGKDEIILYARVSDAAPNMRIGRYFITPSSIRFVGGPTYGLIGDVLMLGDWSTDATGDDRRGWMIARRTTTTWLWARFPSETLIPWGSQPGTDRPISIDADGDGLNDIAVYRTSDRGWYVIRSSDGQLAAPLAIFGDSPVFTLPLGYLQGTIAR